VTDPVREGRAAVAAARGRRPTREEAHALVGLEAAELIPVAWKLAREGHGTLVTYSPKVFIPLTKLCRDVCHYCTFAQAPRRVHRAYLTADEVLAVARAGAAAGCHEALFTLGDKPELRYAAARAQLDELGCATTIDYLVRMARLVLTRRASCRTPTPGSRPSTSCWRCATCRRRRG